MPKKIGANTKVYHKPLIVGPIQSYLCLCPGITQSPIE